MRSRQQQEGGGGGDRKLGSLPTASSLRSSASDKEPNLRHKCVAKTQNKTKIQQPSA